MRIELLGTAFTIHTDEDPERLRDLVDYYKTKVQEIQGSVSTQDPLKIAILAGLLSTDELFKLRDRSSGADANASAKESSSEEGEEIAAIADDLIRTLESSLDE
jgi:cell division protein ZapA